MRTIFLNSWFGRAGKPFLDFIKSESTKTDIFCFMEISPELYSKLSMVLSGFNVLYQKGTYLKTLGTTCGQVIFVRKGIEPKRGGKINIYYQLKDDVGFLQYQELKLGEKSLWLGNVHGKTKPGTKRDTQTRLKQSAKIISFFEDKNGLKIIGGDFNLMPGTKSVKMFEEKGYRNLIEEFGVKSTRNRLAWNQFKHKSGFERQYFADYVFVSPEVRVKSFEVPNIEISDHLPLILDFEI